MFSQSKLVDFKKNIIENIRPLIKYQFERLYINVFIFVTSC